MENAVYDYMKEKWPDIEYNYRGKHYKSALKALGFVDDGYDKYGCCAYTNGNVRVTVYYERGDNYWAMEESQGYSSTTDNFYNTEAGTRDLSGNYRHLRWDEI